MKSRKEDFKLMGLVEGGVASLGKKSGAAWLNFRVELLKLKEDQLRRALDRSEKYSKCKEVDTHCTLLLAR